MENLNLIRNAAWTFHKNSNFEFDELFGEAALAYCEAVENYDPSQGAKLTTFAWWCMKNHLINFCKKQERFRTDFQCHEEFPEHIHPTANGSHEFGEIVQDWPEDCLEVIETVLEQPERFLASTPNYRRRYIGQKRREEGVRRHFRREGWAEDRIDSAVSQIKTLLQTV